MKRNILAAAILLSLSSHALAEDATKTSTTSSTPATKNSTETINSKEKAKISDDFLQDDSDLATAAGPEKISPEKISCELQIDPKSEVKNETVIIWSEKAAVQAFNYSDANIDGKLKELKGCFTDQGYTGYQDALTKSGNIEAIKTQKLTVSSIVDGSTKINKLEDNKWQLKVPLQVVYQNDKEKLTQLLFIDMLVSRKPSGELGILQIIAAPRDKMVDKKSS